MAATTTANLMIKFVDQHGTPCADRRFSNVTWVTVHPDTTWADVAASAADRTPSHYSIAWITFSGRIVHTLGELQLLPLTPAEYSSIARRSAPVEALAHLLPSSTYHEKATTVMSPVREHRRTLKKRSHSD